MRKTILFMAFVFCGAIIYSCSQNGTAAEPGTNLTKDSLIKRGEYLVNTIGCNDCHSPKRMGEHGPEPDPALLLSGHPQNSPLPPIDTSNKGWLLFNQSLTAAVGPWGISYAANLTSDPSGIGNWTEPQFFKAIREGKAKGMDNGRMLLPPMPWPNFARLTDTDLKSIFYYLKSTKPIQNTVPPPVAPNDMAVK